MPRPRRRKFLLGGFIAFLCFMLYTATRGNVSWRVHRHYPNAEISLSGGEDKAESTFFGELCRGLGMRYFSPHETVGLRISSHPTAIDFTHFKGMLITHLTLEHCVVTDIRPLLSMYRPEVSIVGCDLSHLPDEQKRFLSYQPAFDRYSISIPPHGEPQYPAGVGLHSENFYP